MAAQVTRLWANDAAHWTLQLTPAQLPRDVSNTFLRIRYAADEARLLTNGKLLDNNFFNREEWLVGLHRHAENGDVPLLPLELLPMHAGAAIYFAASARAQLKSSGQTVTLDHVTGVPQFQLQFTIPSTRSDPP